MHPAELDVDAVPAAREEIRPRNVRDRKRVMEWRPVREAECGLVRLREEADESRKHVSQWGCSFGKSDGGIGRWGDNAESRGEQACVHCPGNNCGVRDIERDHGLLYGRIEDDLRGLG